MILGKENEAVEKVLAFIEKISAADGLKKGKISKIDNSLKNMIIEKVDILSFFKKKYSWYFELKN